MFRFDNPFFFKKKALALLLYCFMKEIYIENYIKVCFDEVRIARIRKGVGIRRLFYVCLARKR